MTKKTIALAVLIVFVAGIVPAIAATPAKNAPAKPAAKKPVSAVCPVLGTKIPDVSKAPGGSAVYKGKTYYFCCKNCKAKFLKDPEKYIKKTAKPAPAKKPVSAICPVMGTKIPDVSKAAGGSTVYKGKTYYFCCKACKPMFLKDPEKYIKKMQEAEKKAKAGKK